MTSPNDRARLCLNMIVKNEVANLERCLRSVADHIACWVICDTGSTDGTPEVIEDFFRSRGIPGELHRFAFETFEQARNEALDQARRSTLPYDYLLLADADMELRVDDPNAFHDLRAPAYSLLQTAGITYGNIRLLRRESAARYRGVTHEYLDVVAEGRANLDGASFLDHASGANRADKFERDIRLLTEALGRETDRGLIARYTFYLAQSYRDGGQPQAAVEAYLRRAALGHWDQEVFFSLYQAGRLMEGLGRAPDDILAVYRRATETCPFRAEASHAASQLCRNMGRNQDGYATAKPGLALEAPAYGLFVEPWIYTYGLLDEFAVNAYWAGHHGESLDACLKLLALDALPAGYRDRIGNNARFARDRMAERPAPGQGDVMLWPTGRTLPDDVMAMPSLGAVRRGGMVTVITPTRDRLPFLKRALTYVRRQTYGDIEWLILDDGTHRPEALGEFAAPNITYDHIGTRLSIGEKRNRLIDKAKGDIIVQFDDDDYYAPDYIRTMVAALSERNADLVNLRGWFLYDLRAKFFGYWDLMQKEGPHYRCDAQGVAMTILDRNTSSMFEKNHLGYGFGYAFRRKVWEAVKFPALDWNEDGTFAAEAETRFAVDGFHDTTGLCLHILHPGSTSRCFPQHHLPSFVAQRTFPDLDWDTLRSSKGLMAETSADGPDAVMARQRPLVRPNRWRPAQPMGGTELMMTGLRDRMGSALDAINLRINAYDATVEDRRPLVVWIHLDINQALMSWLSDEARRSRVDWFVFVSDWQRARFIGAFGLDAARCVVLRNATDVRDANRTWSPVKPLKVAYTSVPYRGLSVLLDAWDRLRPNSAELHIWSSNKLYGPGWDDTANQGLYERAAALPGVTYHGIVPNAELRAALRGIDILGYPSTFEETSCLSVIEAMAAGCRVICSDYAALPETTSGFARLYPFSADADAHARVFAEVLAQELETPWGGTPALADDQQAFCRRTYDWAVRVAEWQDFLRRIDAERAPTDTGASIPPPSPSRNGLQNEARMAVGTETPPPPTPRRVEPPMPPPDSTMLRGLLRLREHGVRPAGILDVGAHDGQFSRLARYVFPDAEILMIDALAEKASVLAGVAQDLGQASHLIALLGARDAPSTPFFVVDTAARPDLVTTGASAFRENTGFPMVERLVPQRALGTILGTRTPAFQFLKLDVQGAELAVLAGLGSRLSEIEVVMLEMSLVPYNAGAPQIGAVIAALGEQGFVLFDIVEEHRDRAARLLQIDGIFVRSDSGLRPKPPFWS